METGPGPRFTPDGSPSRSHRFSALVTEETSKSQGVLPPAIHELPSTKYATVTRDSVAKISSITPKPALNKELPTISQPMPGRSSIGMGGLPVTGQLFPPMRQEPEPRRDNNTRAPNPKPVNKRFKSSHSKQGVSGLPISNPILDENSLQNPLRKIATMDLETAAKQEELRRAQHPQPLKSHSVLLSNSALPSSILPVRKPVQKSGISGASVVPAVKLQPIMESEGTASTTSAQPSPGIDDMRRRSPRQPLHLAFEPMIHPPPAPLKTPRTMSSSMTLPSTRAQAKPDTWDLLSVPHSTTASPILESPVPTTSRSKSRLTTSPVARSINAVPVSAVPVSSRPTSTGRHSRTRSLSNPQKPRSGDIIFTDPRTPPPIPKRCDEMKAIEEAGTENTESTRGSPPPPYKTDASKTPMEKPLTNRALSVQPYRLTAAGIVSPVRTEARLSLFPAVPSSRTTAVGLARGPAPGLPRTPSPPRTTNKAVSQNEHSKVQQQTIMLLKEIEYSQPIDVNEIVEQYLGKKPLSSPSTIVQESVLNRPRPVPRTPETGCIFQFFKRDEPLDRKTHRRALSCSSVQTRKSLLHETTASSDELPTLPPVPRYDPNAMRPFLNQTKSMTFEEKMLMFFPGSPSNISGSVKVSRPRSSSLFDMTSEDKAGLARSYFKGDEMDRRTNRSSATTVRTHSLFNVSERHMSTRHVSKISTKAMHHPNEGSAHPLAQAEKLAQSPRQSKRQSSPVLLDTGLETPSTARSTEGHMADRKSVESVANTIVPSASTDKVDSPVLDATVLQHITSDEAEILDENSSNGDQSHYIVPVILDQSTHVPQNEAVDTWHRRVGDMCPTFSERKGSSKPRKVFPPAPLALGKAGTGPRFVAAEPSPLESPTHALELINAQLKKLEESDQQSAINEQQRMTLLANLEMEMSMQESQWQLMRRNTIRDSLSTTTTSPLKEFVPENMGIPAISTVERHSLRSILAETRKSRQPVDSSLKIDSRNRRSMLSNAGSRISYLTVSHSTSQLGSPTPPDTDESDFEDQMEVPLMLNQVVMDMPSPPSLWRVTVPSPVVIANCPNLWSPTLKRAFDSSFRPYIASLAPTTRKSSRQPREQPKIESSKLWAPAQNKPKRFAEGLWAPTPKHGLESAPASKSKTLSRKPSRKSKRITILPDILESPLPLPDKRGTLGIFQFPWGETSDMASVPAPIFTSAIPGTMTSGRTSIDPFFSGYQQQYFPMTNGQATSYFDEIDEDEDAGDNFSDFDSEDDDFDESTLWEIASLLQSSEVPTRDSLLPGEWLNGHRGSGESFNLDSHSSVKSPTQLYEEIVPLVLDVSNHSAAIFRSAGSLWVKPSRSASYDKGLGLSQPTSWASYATPYFRHSRALTKHKKLSTVESVTGSLWFKPQVKEMNSSSLLWSLDNEKSSNSHPLWEPLPAVVSTTEKRVVSSGLWTNQPTSQQESLSRPLESTGTTLRKRPFPETPVPQVTSSNLWKHLRTERNAPHSWIHAGTWKSNKLVPRTRNYQGRFSATPANWAAALADAQKAGHPTKATPSLWFRTNHQASPPHNTAKPSLWVGSPRRASAESTGMDTGLQTSTTLPRPRRLNSFASEYTKTSPDFTGQGLWSRVEAASRLSRMGQRTDWIIR